MPEFSPAEHARNLRYLSQITDYSIDKDLLIAAAEYLEDEDPPCEQELLRMSETNDDLRRQLREARATLAESCDDHRAEHGGCFALMEMERRLEDLRTPLMWLATRMDQVLPREET